MPLTKTGKEVLAAMTKQYGAKKGKEVFYSKAHSMGAKWHSPDRYDDQGTSPVPARREYHSEQEGLPEGKGSKGKPTGGTENLGTTAQTKQAGYLSTPTGGAKKWPSAVDSFDDGV